VLRNFNVEDAFDVEMAKISNIKGFGPSMRAALLLYFSLTNKLQLVVAATS
jgi:hypothetical protein